ncbi:hypothetical protein CSB95_5443 [Pseudomonas aeruginosa]|nr:hypothetical protein CSB95_5443 [Pseudomonas aeruginosa]
MAKPVDGGLGLIDGPVAPTFCRSLLASDALSLTPSSEWPSLSMAPWA